MAQKWIKVDNLSDVVKRAQQVERRDRARTRRAQAILEKEEREKQLLKERKERLYDRDVTERLLLKGRKKLCSASERVDWLMLVASREVAQVRESEAPDARAWHLFCRMKADPEFEVRFWDNVRDREFKRAEMEQKRSFVDDGRDMEARLKELDGLLAAGDLLPGSTPAVEKVMERKRALSKKGEQERAGVEGGEQPVSEFMPSAPVVAESVAEDVADDEVEGDEPVVEERTRLKRGRKPIQRDQLGRRIRTRPVRPIIVDDERPVAQAGGMPVAVLPVGRTATIIEEVVTPEEVLPGPGAAHAEAQESEKNAVG